MVTSAHTCRTLEYGKPPEVVVESREAVEGPDGVVAAASGDAQSDDGSSASHWQCSSQF